MRTAAGLAARRPLVLAEPYRVRASAGFLAAPATTGPRRTIPGQHRRGRFAPLVRRSGSDAGAQYALTDAWGSSNPALSRQHAALSLLPQRDSGGEDDRPHTLAVEIRPTREPSPLTITLLRLPRRSALPSIGAQTTRSASPVERRLPAATQMRVARPSRGASPALLPPRFGFAERRRPPRLSVDIALRGA